MERNWLPTRFFKKYVSSFPKTVRLGAGEMVQWLGTLAILEKNPGSIPRTHRMAHNHL